MVVLHYGAVTSNDYVNARNAPIDLPRAINECYPLVAFFPNRQHVSLLRFVAYVINGNSHQIIFTEGRKNLGMFEDTDLGLFIKLP
jgi:hypothetical protein